MTPIRVASILAVAAALAVLGCKSETAYQDDQDQLRVVQRPPADPAQPENPMAGQVQGRGLGRVVPWSELARALPPGEQGWVPRGQAEGETDSKGILPSSRVRVELSQGPMLASVRIMDGVAARPFNVKESSPGADSSDSREVRVDIGGYPGLCTVHADRNEAEVTVVLEDRLRVAIRTQNTPDERPALQLARMIDFRLLQRLIVDYSPRPGVRED